MSSARLRSLQRPLLQHLLLLGPPKALDHYCSVFHFQPRILFHVDRARLCLLRQAASELLLLSLGALRLLPLQLRLVLYFLRHAVAQVDRARLCFLRQAASELLLLSLGALRLLPLRLRLVLYFLRHAVAQVDRARLCLLRQAASGLLIR